MESSLHKNNVDNEELRNSLFYGKYKYRAKIYLLGLSRTPYVDTIDRFKRNIAVYLASCSEAAKRDARWGTPSLEIEDLKSIKFDLLEKYFIWREAYTKNHNKVALIRIECDHASVFSNDLSLLKTLEDIDPNPYYTLADVSIPYGVKYFCNEPKFKYRVYLKNSVVSLTIKEEIRNIIDRYSNTETKIIPSSGLERWLSPNYLYRGHYRDSHIPISSHLNYDNESTYTLLTLLMGEVLNRKYKLEKRP
jgi:hypothetical protein